MLKVLQILVTVLILAASVVTLGACGQKGPLMLPTAPAAATSANSPSRLPAGAPAAPASSTIRPTTL